MPAIRTPSYAGLGGILGGVRTRAYLDKQRMDALTAQRAEAMRREQQSEQDSIRALETEERQRQFTLQQEKQREDAMQRRAEAAEKAAMERFRIEVEMKAEQLKAAREDRAAAVATRKKEREEDIGREQRQGTQRAEEFGRVQKRLEGVEAAQRFKEETLEPWDRNIRFMEQINLTKTAREGSRLDARVNRPDLWKLKKGGNPDDWRDYEADLKSSALAGLYRQAKDSISGLLSKDIVDRMEPQTRATAYRLRDLILEAANKADEEGVKKWTELLIELVSAVERME